MKQIVTINNYGQPVLKQVPEDIYDKLTLMENEIDKRMKAKRTESESENNGKHA